MFWRPGLRPDLNPPLPVPLPTFSFPSGAGRAYSFPSIAGRSLRSLGYALRAARGRWSLHFPQAPGAHSVRLATRFARRAVARSGPAARPSSPRAPRLLPVTCPGPWCGARRAGLAAGSRHDVRERAGPGLRHRRRVVAGLCEAAGGGKRPCTAPAPCAARVRDTRRGLGAGGPRNSACPTHPTESRRIPLNPAYPVESHLSHLSHLSRLSR